MMKKKTLATLLTLTMLATAAVPVFAADVTTETGQETTVTYDVTSSFTVVIPESVALTNGTGSGEITVTDAVIDFGKNLNVTITSATNYDAANSAFRLRDGDKESYVKYTIKNGSVDVKKDVAFLTVSAGTATGAATLTYTADKATKAGNYTDKLTFTVGTAVDTPAE